jgi:hypothetical protein
MLSTGRPKPLKNEFKDNLVNTLEFTLAPGGRTGTGV